LELKTPLYFYSLFGLTIASEKVFDELILTAETTKVDVFIRFCPVESRMPEEDTSKVMQLITENLFCLQLQDFARIQAVHQDEQTIIDIEVLKPERYSYIKSWLFGSVLTGVLHMHNRFALHASAVNTKNGVVLFCGRSGIGKSTIATRLNQFGFDIVSDDKAVLVQKEDNRIYIEPSLQITRLWDDSIAKLEDDSFMESPESVSLKEDKFQFLIKKENQIVEPLPVKAIYILRRIRKEHDLQIRSLTGKLKHARLIEQIHRRQYVRKLNRTKELWNYTARIANTLPVYAILRPNLTTHQDFTEYVKIQIEE